MRDGADQLGSLKKIFMFKRLKDKWEIYAVIIAILLTGYYGREYLYKIEQSNSAMLELAKRHSDYRDSVFYAKWEISENMEESRFQASEIEQGITNHRLQQLEQRILGSIGVVRRRLRAVAETQAEALRRDSIDRAGSGPIAPIIITR